MEKESWFEKQVREIKEDIKHWPEWIKKTARYDGNMEENLNGK